jgi:predicted nucleic acid-binding protein
MRVALDSNILLNAEGMATESRKNATIELLLQIPQSNLVIPAQCLGEMFSVLARKSKNSLHSITTLVARWSNSHDVAISTWSSFQAAFSIASAHKLQFWDSLILAVSAENQCRMLLSEDMQHDFTWNNVTIVNPYLAPMHSLLKKALNSP